MSIELTSTIRQSAITSAPVARVITTQPIIATSTNIARPMPIDRVTVQNDVVTLVTKTLAMIKEVDDLITNVGDIVLVCGDTGAGKSTLINLLAGAELIAVKPQNSNKLYVDCINGNVSRIGHTRESETTIPSKVQIESTSYWDCPGFNDSKGPIVDISNAFYVNKLLTAAARVKIMIVVEEASINGDNRGQSFKALVSRLGALFQNKKDLVDGLCLVFTKVRDIDNFRVEIQNIVDTDKGINDANRELLSAIILNSKIATFKLPTQSGAIPGNIKDEIIVQIESTNFIIKPQVNITVSKDSLIVLARLVGEVDKKIGEISGGLNDKVLSKIDTLSIDQIKTIQGKLESFSEKYFSDVGFANYGDLIDNMKSDVFDTILAIPNFKEVQEGISHNLLELKNLVEYFDNFFAKIIPGASIDNAKLQKAFLGLNTAIQMHHVESELKGNKEALNKAQAEIAANSEAHTQALAAQSHQYNEQLANQTARIDALVQDLNNANSAAQNAQNAAQAKMEEINRVNQERIAVAMAEVAKANAAAQAARNAAAQNANGGGGKKKCIIL